MTTRQLFAHSAYGYCPVLIKTVFGYEDDRGDPVDYVRNELFQCTDYASSSFFKVNSGAALRLQNVLVQDFTIQLKAIILLEGGSAALANVTFSNVQPGTSPCEQAIILSTQDCDPFDFCGSFTYQVGKVEYLNNGNELSLDSSLNLFIRLSFVTSILIEDVAFQYNTLIAASDELGLITIDTSSAFR